MPLRGRTKLMIGLGGLIALVVPVVWITASQVKNKALEAKFEEIAKAIEESPAQTNSPAADLKGYSRDLAKSVKLTQGQDIESAEQLIRAYFSSENQKSESTHYDRTVTASGLTKVIVTRDGLKDDSVKAEQLIAYFKPVQQDAGQLVAYGMRVKCWRGATNNKWSTELCP